MFCQCQQSSDELENFKLGDFEAYISEKVLGTSVNELNKINSKKNKDLFKYYFKEYLVRSYSAIAQLNRNANEVNTFILYSWALKFSELIHLIFNISDLVEKQYIQDISIEVWRAR